jgi:hypothetical protein
MDKPGTETKLRASALLLLLAVVSAMAFLIFRLRDCAPLGQ